MKSTTSIWEPFRLPKDIRSHRSSRCLRAAGRDHGLTIPKCIKRRDHQQMNQRKR